MSQTGTPVPGGLSYKEVVRSLGRIAANRSIIGVDVATSSCTGALIDRG